MVVTVVVFVSDPKQWSEDNVRQWLMWAIKDFSLEGVSVQEFQMKGRDLVGMGRDSFLNRTPPFMGDILWQHLEFLQKGECSYLQPHVRV